MQFLSGTPVKCLLFFLVIFTAFFRLGDTTIMRFDEARNGVNALEMAQNGDYVNLHYQGEPDNWNAKPPLLIWAQVLSFRLLGKSDFSLRFSAALAGVMFFLFFFRTVNLYTTEATAFTACLVLLCVEGIFGPHVARTGDFDAFLLLFTSAGIYYFLSYLDWEDKTGLWKSALAFGLAFMSKGPALGIVLPALFLYTVWRKELSSLLKKKALYSALFVFLLFPLLWYILSARYGFRSEIVQHGATNAFDRLFFYDIFERFFSTNIHTEEYRSKPDFFLTYLDTHFNLWHYLFLAGVAYAVVQLLRSKSLPDRSKPNLRVFSHLFWVTMALFLTVAASNHRWYMAPALPFIAFLTVRFCLILAEQNRKWFIPFTLLFLFTFVRHISAYFSEKSYPASVYNQKTEIENSPVLTLFKDKHYEQEELYYLLLWADKTEYREGDGRDRDLIKVY